MQTSQCCDLPFACGGDGVWFRAKGFGFFFGDVRWGSIRERSIGEGKGSISHANLTLVSANVFFFIYFVMAFVIMEFRTQK